VASAGGGVSRKVALVHTPLHGIKTPIFADIAEAMVWALGQQGLEVTELFGSFSADGANVVMGPNCLSWARLVPPPDSILYNMEQLVPGSVWATEEVLRAYRGYRLWNYAREVEPRLLHWGLSSTYVPVSPCPLWATAPRGPKQPVDVCFFGFLSDRRKALLEAMSAEGLQVYRSQQCYGADRDRICSQSKVMLNIHYWDEHPVFESLRVIWALYNGLLVVSEDTPGADQDRVKDAPGLHCVPRAEMVATARRLAGLPRSRRLEIAEESRSYWSTRLLTLPEVF